MENLWCNQEEDCDVLRELIADFLPFQASMVILGKAKSYTRAAFQ